MASVSPISPDALPHTASLTVLISGSVASDALVREGATLAEALGVAWEAVYVENPESNRHGAAGARAADALGCAMRSGGTVATIAAATLGDGILEHLRGTSATHLLVEPERPGRWGHLWRGSMFDALAARFPGTMLHVLATDLAPSRETEPAAKRTRGHPVHYLLAAASVIATLLIAELLQLATGTRALDLLFLFPVIAVAARLGLRPALLAAALSVFSYNYFLIAPTFSFDVRAPQNLVMTAVLFAAAAYTSLVMQRMRGRLLLSDRSARENASLVTLAQRLTRDADWEATALTLCEHVHGLFGLHVAMVREVQGELALVAALPPEVVLGPVDRAALDWSWAHGEESGAGTSSVAASDWQFHPLKTSLGMLAILGLARDDGRDPVRPDQRILLSTILAQAALAHERLHLEDQMHAASTKP